jgi:hypothetical protein
VFAAAFRRDYGNWEPIPKKLLKTNFQRYVLYTTTSNDLLSSIMKSMFCFSGQKIVLPRQLLNWGVKPHMHLFSADRNFFFPLKKRDVFRKPECQKSCHSGKNQKTCPHETYPRENGDEYFLIFTRNPLFPSFFDLLILAFNKMFVPLRTGFGYKLCNNHAGYFFCHFL